MPQYAFGSGTLWGVNTTTNSTPMKFGVLQEGSVEFSATTKQLMGQYQFPVAVARGPGKITGKAKFARISGALYGDLFFGISPSTGLVNVANDESGTIPATPGPYTLTATNTATYVTDLGVYFTATGVPLTKVASAPSTGQYSVTSAGVYTFAAADQGLGVKISYTYTAASGGKVLTITNQLLGTTPTFTAVLSVLYNSVATNIQLNACTSSKLTFPTKLEDFLIPEFEFEAMADSSGTIGKISATE